MVRLASIVAAVVLLAACSGGGRSGGGSPTADPPASRPAAGPSTMATATGTAAPPPGAPPPVWRTIVGIVGDAYGIRVGMAILAPVLFVGSVLVAPAGRFVNEDIARIYPAHRPMPTVPPTDVTDTL